MKMALVLSAAIAVAAALTVWRTQHSAEVWHAAADAPS
jgi:hypothetical protein